MGIETEIDRQKALGASEAKAAAQEVAIQEAFAEDQTNKSEERTVIGPQATVLKTPSLLKVLERYKNPGDLINKFDLILKEYRPDLYQYGWTDLEDGEAQAHCRAGEYIPVKKEEVLPDTKAPIHFSAEKNAKWMSLTLVKIPLAAYDSLYTVYQDIALARLLRDNAEQYKYDVRNVSRGKAQGYIMGQE